ncbi:MarR family winged helix-turn-helix transcriptional regulator [Christensenella intestinihominis]|uniref:MarR family winged helix-turn-helix transcriptional regulator n=1 Tax=Christensenella intestinihominis TaxID=1851429 RepID=UPI00082C0E09|nr:MarR family transcriptional regulator [Christensenella intestinihominis]
MRELAKKLSILSRRAGINLDRKLKDIGITRGQLVYLMCICDHEGMSQEGLSEELWINKGAVARAVRKFEQDGYITRIVSPKDRRQYGLYPTEKTKKAYHAIRAVEAEWEDYMTRNLSAGEKKTLDVLLEKLLADME